jgi:hypothetical protein
MWSRSRREVTPIRAPIRALRGGACLGMYVCHELKSIKVPCKVWQEAMQAPMRETA